MLFQSTLPRRERRSRMPYNSMTVEFQSTLPRRERLNAKDVVGVVNNISIHAPAKGATFIGGRCILYYDYFNPRSREGSDSLPRMDTKHYQLFQSTLPRRERQMQLTTLVDMTQFQSTLPRRERPLSMQARSGIAAYFNPRSREGSDAYL